MQIYIRKLCYSTAEAQLDELLSLHGTVTGVRIPHDHETGESKGIGFVDMPHGRKDIERSGRTGVGPAPFSK
jgi:RNA recognition motif-containing protein